MPAASVRPMSHNNTTRYRLLVENSSDLVAEVTPVGQFLYVTPNFERVLGYSPEELVGSEVMTYVHPEDQQLARHHLALPESSFTLRYRNKRGDWRWLDVNGRDFATPSGEIRGVLIARDVTARRQAEDALRRSEQHTRAILDNAFDAVVATSAAGNITEWNSQAERLFGWRRDEVIGRKMVEILVPENLRVQHAEGLRHLLVNGLARNLNPSCEMLALHRNGHEFPVELSVAPIPSTDGVSFCSFIRDLTGLKEAQAARARLEAQLLQSQKLEAIGRLAGGIAHDFNNILTVITANNELARMEMGEDHPAADCHSEINRACQRAADLVRQILSFSRPQPSERRVLDLAAVVQEAVRMLRPVLPASIEIRTSLHSAGASVLADSGQLMQVLLNLATNAAHAMRQNAGLLEFSLQGVILDESAAAAHPGLRPGNYARLSVHDTGHGMDAATLEKIFEPFFTTKSAGDGTGLGLSVVHGIVKSHGGAVQVCSRPNKGTSFHLYFPVVASGSPRPKPSAANLTLGNGERILFVEDESALAESGRRILLRIGYQPTVCRNASEALTLLRTASAPFAAVVCDLTMPGRSGVEFAEESRPFRKGIPFILTTGSSAALALDVLKARGVAALLEKPFTPQALAETLRRVLGGIKTAS